MTFFAVNRFRTLPHSTESGVPSPVLPLAIQHRLSLFVFRVSISPFPISRRPRETRNRRGSLRGVWTQIERGLAKLEPVGAIGDPPAHNGDGNGGEQAPD